MSPLRVSFLKVTRLSSSYTNFRTVPPGSPIPSHILPPKSTDRPPLLDQGSARRSEPRRHRRTFGFALRVRDPHRARGEERRIGANGQQQASSPRRSTVEYPQLFFAGGEAALARRRERAARVGPNGVNGAAIITAEVLAAFVLSKDEHQLSVVPPCKGRPREVSSSSLLEASDVAIFELDPIVLAAGAAG